MGILNTMAKSIFVNTMVVTGMVALGVLPQIEKIP